jgi:rhodanese-related sulfurtransferase
MQWIQHLGKSSVPEVSVEEARQRQAAGALLVDVREPDEWQQGHAAGAQHLRLGHLAARLASLPRHSEVLFICRSGNRSARATAFARGRPERLQRRRWHAGLDPRRVRAGVTCRPAPAQSGVGKDA